jgi:hypothetical protein
VGGRSSHFCPNCQPRPRHVATTGPARTVHRRAPRTMTTGLKRIPNSERTSLLRTGSR